MNYKHGLYGTPAYVSWQRMLARCYYPANNRYARYGGAGITVCDEWRTFVGFFADMGERPPGTTLDRIDNDLGYYKTNCRWATPLVQSRNRRSVVSKETANWIRYSSLYAGVRQVDLAKAFGCSQSTVSNILRGVYS